jgi:hypothetical protein
LVQPFGPVVFHAQSEHFWFPCGRRQFHSVKQVEHSLNACRAFSAVLVIRALPGQQEALKVLQRYRLDFRAQPVQREPMNSRQQAAVAPFEFGNARMKSSAQNKSFGFQSQQGGFNFGGRQIKNY